MNLQKYYETVMQLSHGIVVTLDLDGGIIHGNTRLEYLTGYSMKDMAGVDWFEVFVAPDNRRKARKEIFDQARGQGISFVSGAIKSKSGDTLYIDWKLKPLTDSHGTVVSILCVGQDVTNHMRRQKGLLRERFTLLERNKELRCLYEITMLMSDIDQDIDSILGSVVQLLPSAFQCPERTHVSLCVDDTCWRSAGFKDDGVVLSESISVNREKRGMLTVVADVDGQEEDYRLAVFIEDEMDMLKTAAKQIGLIISKKETKQAKQALEQQLMQADRLAKIGQFSAGVAHEINEPLANILGFAQLALQNSDIPGQVARDLNCIVDSSLHAREVIKKLMFFSRKMPTQFIPTSVNDAVRQGLRITESGAKRNRIEIQCELDEGLPSIMADPQHITQVVVNLIANSIQAMADGGVLTVTTMNSNNDAYLIVQDTGPGISPEELKQIFNPFYTTKDVNKGTGLGLSVVHGIVKEHDGFIQVQSKVGEGSRVEVVFPSRQLGSKVAL